MQRTSLNNFHSNQDAGVSFVQPLFQSIALLMRPTAYRDHRIMTSITSSPLPSSELEDHISSRTPQLALVSSDSA
jgi:hypothetical protein